MYPCLGTPALEYQHINYTLNDIYYVVSTPG